MARPIFSAQMLIVNKIWSKLKMFAPRSAGRAFGAGLLTTIVFKFWLVHTEEIYGYTAEYDCLWYLNSAKYWYWNTPYSWTAFVRPPAYPLFIALVHSLSIPLRIATECLQIGGYLVLIAALRKARCPRWICLCAFILLLLHPASFQGSNYVYPDTFYAAIMTYAVAGILFTWVTHCITPAIYSGIAFAILWNTREESFLLPIIFLTYVAFAFCFHYSQTRSWRNSGKRVFAPALSMFAATAFLIIAVNATNYRAFGVFAKSETRAPSLAAAYRALLRIKPSHPQRFVAISREARETAYVVSPTFAQLKPHFESDLGRGWEAQTLSHHGIHDEIGTGWFLWALRGAADRAGVYRDPRTAARFYSQVAKEIDLACDQRRTPSRFVLSIFIDPNAIASIRYLPESFRRICRLFLLPYQLSPDREDAVLRPPQRTVYDEMAGRRASLTRIGMLRIVGWAFRFSDPLTMVAYDTGGGEIDSAISSFGIRPDVVKQFESQGEVPLKNEFGLPLIVRREGDPNGKLVFITQSGRQFISVAQSVLTGQAPTENGASDGEPLIYNIFAREFTPAASSLPRSVENFIGNYYRYILLGLTWAGVAAGIVLVLNFRKWRLIDHLNAFFILLASIIAARVALFVFIDATSWPGNDLRYLFPVMPLYSLLLVLLIFQAVRVAGSTVANVSGELH